MSRTGLVGLEFGGFRPSGERLVSERRITYQPGVDGLRALAVAGVVGYHLATNWLPGGFLGVEVFFVVSGYLITSLLATEWEQHGRIDLGRFWLRRARRLLPAVFVLILAVLLYTDLFLPTELADLRQDALASFAYATNWYLVLDQKSYFQAMGRPSLLQHLWSLAVEEQFYVIWPLALALAFRRVRRGVLVLFILVGAVASTALMAHLYQPDADPTRLYYGTDTRASGLLIGAALGLMLRSGQLSRLPRLLPDLVGVATIAALVWQFMTVDELSAALYHGGFLVVASLTATLLATIVHPSARVVQAVLGSSPLRWIGLRSYSIYLWHWPVVALTRPEVDVPLSGATLILGQVGLILLLSEISYRFVESPARRGAIERKFAALAGAFKEWRESRGFRRGWLGAQWLTATATVIACVSVFGTSVARAAPPPPPSYLAVDSVHTVSGPLQPPVSVSPTNLVTGPDLQVVAASTPVETNVTPSPTPPAQSSVAASVSVPLHITLIGDSVMVGAANALEQRLGATNYVEVDAHVGRQVSSAIADLRERRAVGTLGDIVVLHVGTNGSFRAWQFDELMTELANVRRVVFVNLKVPRTWEAADNQVIADGVARYPNTVLVDWYDVGNAHPEAFWQDRIHLRPEGARLYAQLIAEAVSGSTNPKTMPS
jgi:peptidoglycan/LPS O-acetylase OafA/YrhL